MDISGLEVARNTLDCLTTPYNTIVITQLVLIRVQWNHDNVATRHCTKSVISYVTRACVCGPIISPVGAAVMSVFIELLRFRARLDDLVRALASTRCLMTRDDEC